MWNVLDWALSIALAIGVLVWAVLLLAAVWWFA